MKSRIRHCPRTALSPSTAAAAGYTWVTKRRVIAFHVSRRRREMYCGHACVCVSVCASVCLSAAACLHYCTDPDVTWGSGRGCPLVVHYWADLQPVHGLHCYDNITRTVIVTILPSSPYLCWKGTLNSNQPTNKLAATSRYDDVVRTRNVSECSVLALCLV